MTDLKIVFSRKGFDSSSGRAPSPIIDGVPISLPIPHGKYPSVSTYRDLDLGDALSQAQSKYTADDFCHEDPMFWDDRRAFGQTGAAQSQLETQKVGIGDVFLFFGLFAESGRDRHHRIFAYLLVEEVQKVGSHPRGDEAGRTPRRHPHTIEKWDAGGKWDANNTLYLGRGAKARKAHPSLRLTKPGGLASDWLVPPWLRRTELTYHKQPRRWLEDGTLRVVGRGQEFVAEVRDRPEPKMWLDEMIAAIGTDE
jgi:hypothetical protein